MIVNIGILNFNIKVYNYIIKNYNPSENNIIYDNNNNVLFKIPVYPILIGDKIDFNYYNDIIRY